MRAIDVLIQDLETSRDWKVSASACCVENKRNSIRVWIANIPVVNTNVYQPAPMNLSFYDKWRLWQATKVARENAMLNILEGK